MDKSFDMRSALRYAIHAEKQASEFYRAWSDNAREDRLRERLVALADWEDEHRKMLSAYYERLFGELAKIDPEFAVDPALRVCADEFKDLYSLVRIASAVYLSEMTAAELYETMASRADVEGARMFRDIAAMERGHMQEALRFYNRLRNDIEGSGAVSGDFASTTS